jgi:thiol-disulfide isomerase/thioredoxin
MNLSFGKTMRWWEKGFQPNMRAIHTAQELVDSLINAGDGLVVVDFFSPGCAGCHALHPKVVLVSRILCIIACHLSWEFNFAVPTLIFTRADLPVCGAEPGRSVPASEL